MQLLCPTCKSEITSDNMQISSDIAKCTSCNSIHKISELIELVKPVSSSPPAGSVIEMTQGRNETLEILYPKTGFTRKLAPVLLFATVWLLFITFWTIFALQGSIVFALFSIPFWLIGIGMVLWTFNNAFTSEVIMVEKRQITLKKRRFFFKVNVIINIKDIVSIGLQQSLGKSEAGKNLSSLRTSNIGGNPAITTANGTDYFFVFANTNEQKWMVDFLNNLVDKLKQKI